MSLDTFLSNIWDYLTEHDICTDKELQLITNINGYNEETFNQVKFARTGYRSIRQLQDYIDNQ